MKKYTIPGNNPQAKLIKERASLLDALLFDVSRAADATTLLTYRRDALADNCLDAVEKNEICHAIEKRFAFLNATNGLDQKSRWS
jgi:hypothetical protein